MKENTLKKLGASAAAVLTGVFAAASNQLVAFAGEDSDGKGGDCNFGKNEEWKLRWWYIQ